MGPIQGVCCLLFTLYKVSFYYMKFYRIIFISQIDSKKPISFIDHQGERCLFLHKFWNFEVNINLQMHLPSRWRIVFENIKWMLFLKLRCFAILILEDEVDTANANAFDLETLIGS